MNPESTSFDSRSPSEWLLYLHDSDSIPLEHTPVSHISLELALLLPPLDPVYPSELLQETQRPVSFDERPTVSPICFLPTAPPPTPPSLEPVAFLPPKWHKIPQKAYARNHWDCTLSEDIVFQVDGFPGTNMGDALRGEFATLKDRDDLVMRDAHKTAFQCRFLFFGCPVESYQISTMYWNRARDPIPRSKLAHEVAKNLEKYLDSITGSNITDPSTGEQWEVDEGFVHLDNIFLRKLESVSKGSYQPVFYVVIPSM